MGLHLAACMPNLTQPYDMVGPIAWQNDLTVETFEFENGSFKVPDRPGLGFTLNQDAVSAYTIEEKVLKQQEIVQFEEEIISLKKNIIP